MADEQTAQPTLHPSETAEDVKLTDYGYPGDSTPDWYSAHGIGDRDNQLLATPEHQSVALTIPERYRLFGYTGKSQGRPFIHQGKLYWDDDTAPEGDYRIDRYSPKHPPDSLTLRTGHERPEEGSALVRPHFESLAEPYGTLYEDLREGMRPGDEYRLDRPDESPLAPRNLVHALRQAYPEYAQAPWDDDRKLWDSFKQKFPTPYEQIRAVSPDLKDWDKNRFLKAIKDKYFPKENDAIFADRMEPPSGWAALGQQILPNIIRQWYKSSAKVAEYPATTADFLRQAGQALGITLRQLGLNPIDPRTEEDLTEGYIKNFVIDPEAEEMFRDWAERIRRTGAKWEAHHPIPEPHGQMGRAGQVLGTMTGAAPEIAMLFTPGIGPKAALVHGLIWELVNQNAGYRERAMDNRMAGTAEALSNRLVQQWLMYTPRARYLSAIYWGLDTILDAQAQEFIEDPQKALNNAFTGNHLADLFVTGGVAFTMGGVVSLGPEKMPREAQDAFNAARAARERGDYKETARLLDRTQMLLPEGVRRAAANNLLAWRNEAIEARAGDNPMELAGQRGIWVLKPKPKEPLLLGAPPQRLLLTLPAAEPLAARVPEEPRAVTLAPGPRAHPDIAVVREKAILAGRRVPRAPTQAEREAEIRAGRAPGEYYEEPRPGEPFLAREEPTGPPEPEPMFEPGAEEAGPESQQGKLERYQAIKAAEQRGDFTVVVHLLHEGEDVFTVNRALEAPKAPPSEPPPELPRAPAVPKPPAPAAAPEAAPAFTPEQESYMAGKVRRYVAARKKGQRVANILESINKELRAEGLAQEEVGRIQEEVYNRGEGALAEPAEAAAPPEAAAAPSEEAAPAAAPHEGPLTPGRRILKSKLINRGIPAAEADRLARAAHLPQGGAGERDLVVEQILAERGRGPAAPEAEPDWSVPEEAAPPTPTTAAAPTEIERSNVRWSPGTELERQAEHNVRGQIISGFGNPDEVPAKSWNRMLAKEVRRLQRQAEQEEAARLQYERELEAEAQAGQPELLTGIQRHGGLPSPKRLREMEASGENLGGEMRRVHDAWKALNRDVRAWLKKQGIMARKLFRDDAKGLDRTRADLAQEGGFDYHHVGDLLADAEHALMLAKQRKLKFAEKYSAEGAEGVSDQFYYSGFDLGKAYEELARLLEKTGWREFLAPGSRTEAAEVVIRREIGKQQRDNQRMAQVWWHQQKLEDEYKWAYSADRRRAWWLSHPTATLMKWFELADAGHSTGNKVADFMFKKHFEFMHWLANIEEARGFTHRLVETYIPRVVRAEDVAEVAAWMRRRGWGDPNFIRPRRFPDLIDLHRAGFELTTYNLEDAAQMRLEDSNRAHSRAEILEGLNETFVGGVWGGRIPLAISRTQMEAMRKINPRLAEEIQSQCAPRVWRSPRAQPQGPEPHSVQMKLFGAEDPEALKEHGDPNQTYWVHPFADFLLDRATGPITWPMPQLTGPAIGFAHWLKQRTVGINLGLSMYHDVHMLNIGLSDTLTDTFMRTLHGTATLQDWAHALEDVFTQGVGTRIRSLRANQKLLNWYLHPDATRLGDLSPHDRFMFELQQAAGFVPQISHERQIQLSRMLVARATEAARTGEIQLWGHRLMKMSPESAMKGARAADIALDFTYAAISGRPYQRMLFGWVIPSLKMYSFNRAALTLLDTHPEFYRPEYRMQRDIELVKIAKEVDDRYGEQNLRLAFEDPHMKALGQVSLLSYSWQRSFLRVFGGGVHSGVKALAGKPLTYSELSRLTYLLTYVTSAAARNLLISSLIGAGVGAGLEGVMDAIYPNIGRDENGEKIRLKPPDWTTTELGGLSHDIAAGGLFGGALMFATNKLVSGLSTLVDVMRNKDYFGNEILPAWDKNKDWWTNFQEQVWPDIQAELRFIGLQQMPFTVQQLFRPGAKNPRDVLLQMMGVPIAPKYAQRTELENEIVNDYINFITPREKTEQTLRVIDARREYREAMLGADIERQRRAADHLRALGMSPKTIRETAQAAHETEAQRMFSHMPSGLDKKTKRPSPNLGRGDQLYYWRHMSPQEKAQFRPYLHKDLRALSGAGPGYQEGGIVGTDTPVIVGEAGPEQIITPSGEEKTVGASGPELHHLAPGTEVIPNEDTALARPSRVKQPIPMQEGGIVPEAPEGEPIPPAGLGAAATPIHMAEGGTVPAQPKYPGANAPQEELDKWERDYGKWYKQWVVPQLLEHPPTPEPGADPGRISSDPGTLDYYLKIGKAAGLPDEYLKIFDPTDPKDVQYLNERARRQGVIPDTGEQFPKHASPPPSPTPPAPPMEPIPPDEEPGWEEAHRRSGPRHKDYMVDPFMIIPAPPDPTFEHEPWRYQQKQQQPEEALYMQEGGIVPAKNDEGFEASEYPSVDYPIAPLSSPDIPVRVEGEYPPLKGDKPSSASAKAAAPAGRREKATPRAAPVSGDKFTEDPRYAAWYTQMHQWMQKYGAHPAGQQALAKWKQQYADNPFAQQFFAGRAPRASLVSLAPPMQAPSSASRATRVGAKSGSYTTQLSPAEETAFQKWVADNKIPWKDDPYADYDMRGFWKAQASGDAAAVRDAKSGHFPDKWKTPYHRTFSNQSMYATDEAPHWEGNKLIDKDGNVLADETPQ